MFEFENWTKWPNITIAFYLALFRTAFKNEIQKSTQTHRHTHIEPSNLRIFFLRSNWINSIKDVCKFEEQEDEKLKMKEKQQQQHT